MNSPKRLLRGRDYKIKTYRISGTDHRNKDSYFISLSVKYNYISPKCNFTPEVNIQLTANIDVEFHITPYPDITSTYFQRPILLEFHHLHIRPSEWFLSMQFLNQNVMCISFRVSIQVICTTFLNQQADTLINVAFKEQKLYKA